METYAHENVTDIVELSDNRTGCTLSFNALEPGVADLVRDFIAAGRPSARKQSLEERREGYITASGLGGELENVALVRDETAARIPLRLYYPCTSSDALPMILYCHGGCFVSGGFATHERQFRQLANRTGCIVVAVQYRLAPEYTYPAAHDDVFAAANHIRSQGAALGGDPERVCLMGDSAGGHIALTTSLRLRDAGDWQASSLVLIYPMLDAAASSPSHLRNGDDYVITRDTLLSGFEAYFEGKGSSLPEASPLRRSNLKGLPRTLLLTAEYDPLLDEGEIFFRRLLEQGVEAQCRRYLGVIHGFFQLGGVSATARSAMDDVATYVRRTFEHPAPYPGH